MGAQNTNESKKLKTLKNLFEFKFNKKKRVSKRIKSGKENPHAVKLKAYFMSVLPEYLQGSDSESTYYDIKYEIYYGEFCDKWLEEGVKSNRHRSRQCFELDYDVTLVDQNVYVKVSYDMSRESESRESVLSHETLDSKYEDSERWQYNINAKYDLYKTLMQKDSFWTAEVMNSNIPKYKEQDDEISLKIDYETDWSCVRMSVVERKPANMQNIYFAITGKFDDEDQKLRVDIYHQLEKRKQLICKAIPVEKSQNHKNHPGLYYFGGIHIDLTIFSESKLNDIMLCFDLVRIKNESKNKENTKILGSSECKLESLLKTEDSLIQLKIMKSK